MKCHEFKSRYLQNEQTNNDCRKEFQHKKGNFSNKTPTSYRLNLLRNSIQKNYSTINSAKVKSNIKIVNLPQQEISKKPESCIQTSITSELDEYNDYFFQYLTEKLISSHLNLENLKETKQNVYISLIQKMVLHKKIRSGEEYRSGKTDQNWVLVEYLIRVPDNETEQNKLIYQLTGRNKVISCSSVEKELDDLEEFCCQSFLQKSRFQVINDKEKFELLFSSQGPVVRNSKHLAGRNFIYFCYHGSSTLSLKNIHFKHNKKSIEATNIIKDKSNKVQINKNEEMSFRKLTEVFKDKNKTKKVVKNSIKNNLSIKRSSKNIARSSLMKKSQANNLKDSSKENRLKVINNTFDDQQTMKNNNQPKKDLSSEGLDSQLAKEESFDVIEESTDDENTKSITRKIPSPKLIIKEDKENERKSKRRGSTTISIVTTPKEKLTFKKPPETVKAPKYKFPDMKQIRINIIFKEKNYSKDFLNHNTLQDVYTWIKMTLLSEEQIKPSNSSILLSIKGVSFPLSSDSESLSISSFPSNTFDCLQPKQKFGSDTIVNCKPDNSRFDADFTLPIDFRDLESMTSREYLEKFASVAGIWKNFYFHIFRNNLKNQQKKMNFIGLQTAMQNLYAHLSSALLQQVLFLMGFDPRSETSPDLDFQNLQADTEDTSWKEDFEISKNCFLSICALSNRIICQETTIDGFYVGSIFQSDLHLENADFYNIEEKLESVKVVPLLKRLLLYLRKS